MKFRYFRSSHDDAVDSTFGAAAMATAGQSAPFRACILAFVNRSGSNYVAEALRSTGRFSGFEEVLNDGYLRPKARENQATSFSDYLARVRQEQNGSTPRIWGLKAAPMQLAMLARTKAIPYVLQPHILAVRRRDIVAQAISLFIAEHTQRWTSLDNRYDGTIPYDADRILEHLQGISHSYALLDQILIALALPVYRIDYEEFLDRPNEIVAGFGMAMTGEALVPRLERVGISRQRDDRTAEIRERFRRDLDGVVWEPE